jgi:uncharacterized membrane protein YoaK (UPF0700 family)
MFKKIIVLLRIAFGWLIFFVGVAATTVMSVEIGKPFISLLIFCLTFLLLIIFWHPVRYRPFKEHRAQ